VRVLALDYGASRTGVAVSDETGTIASPLTVIERVNTEPGMRRLLDVIDEQMPTTIVVGIPVSLDARENAQARAVREFIALLAAAIEVPVATYDERFTTKVAQQRGGSSGLDARAAALILEDYLRSVARDDG